MTRLKTTLTSALIALALGAGSTQLAAAAPTAEQRALVQQVRLSSASVPATPLSTPQSDDAFVQELLAADWSTMSDHELLALGLVGQRDGNGSLTGISATAETREIFDSVAAGLQQSSTMRQPGVVSADAISRNPLTWAGCAAALSWFIAQTFIPVGKIGTVAVRSIAIIKRWGVKRTIEVLKRFGQSKNLTEKQFFEDFAKAMSGIAGLAVCAKAVGR